VAGFQVTGDMINQRQLRLANLAAKGVAFQTLAITCRKHTRLVADGEGGRSEERHRWQRSFMTAKASLSAPQFHGQAAVSSSQGIPAGALVVRWQLLCTSSSCIQCLRYFPEPTKEPLGRVGSISSRSALRGEIGVVDHPR